MLPTGSQGIKFLIFFFFIIRLYGITNPPLEKNHNWRQATTNMYARNFLEVDNNILYARVDMAGELSGITAKEFPVFNYLIYLVAKVWGWDHWYGRLISLLVSSVGVWFFFRLVRDYVSGELAAPSTVILLVSIWFGHARIIMPDTFAVSLVLIGLWFGFRFLERGGWWRLLIFLLAATTGALAKLPAGFLLGVLLFPLLDKRISHNRKVYLMASGALLLTICGGWYFLWLPHVVETYGYEHYPMRSVWTGFQEILGDLPETFERFYISAMKGYLAFFSYAAGLVFLFWKKPRHLFFPFMLLSVLFFLYMCKAGSSFYHHNYYIIPFVPVMSVIAAYGILNFKEWLETKFGGSKAAGSAAVILLAISVESVANQQDAFRIRDSEWPKLALENIADAVSSPGDLVAFNQFDGNPQELYFAHRKGWVLTNEAIGSPETRNELRSKGCKFIFLNKKIWGTLGPLPEKQVFEDEYYSVYAL